MILLIAIFQKILMIAALIAVGAFLRAKKIRTRYVNLSEERRAGRITDD